jgi:hypothetical protein
VTSGDPGGHPGKLVLAVIDGLHPEMLRRAIDTDRAPVLAAIAQRSTATGPCSAAFPSVTPVCAAAIATGRLQDAHHVPGMNWYSRAESRYVEYGSSLAAARRFGLTRQLADTVYHLNDQHLSRGVDTVFESLDDAGVRTAGTTYLMYRGRHRHAPAREFALSRLATTTLFRQSVQGPRELFYADIFASRRTGCFSQLGTPGLRDAHAGCVSAHLVEHDLFDFLLLSLPDNDTHSHRHGVDAQVASIAAADRQLERVMHAGGGVEAFLDEHAIIVVADHSHSPVDREVDLHGALDDWEILRPSGGGAQDAEIALCPSQRAAQVYLLVPEGRAESLPRLVAAAREAEGVDLALWLEDGRAVLAGERGQLSFAPATKGGVVDARGARWALDGDLETLGADVDGGVLRAPDYPDALARAWAAAICPTSGDVLLSAAPGAEFPDWGGASHLGGASHGSLHRCDSEGALLVAGARPPARRREDGAWSIVDVAPMTVAHFAAS